MSVLVVAALEAERSAGRRGRSPRSVRAGSSGRSTLPHFAIAFVAIGAVLLAAPPAARRVAVGLGRLAARDRASGTRRTSTTSSTSSRQDYGIPIETAWILTAPLDQTLVPAMTLLDDAFLRPNSPRCSSLRRFAIVVASSPLLRRRDSALILCSGVVTTVVAFWLTGTQVVPRFFSFLLVPLFMLVATGRRVRARAAEEALAALDPAWPLSRSRCSQSSASVPRRSSMADVPRTPRESLREAAAAIRELSPPTTPVVAHVPYPLDLEFHLGRPVQLASGQADVVRACASGRADRLRRAAVARVARDDPVRRTRRHAPLPVHAVRTRRGDRRLARSREGVSATQVTESDGRSPAAARASWTGPRRRPIARVCGSSALPTRFSGRLSAGHGSLGLDHSFWHDEILDVEEFVREGPGRILAGPDLNHELFTLLGWATSSVVGESELALRLWSVVPFVAGVALVTVWLHRRFGALSGLLFLFLATVSPLLLDITRQARGYGLAFLAMSVVSSVLSRRSAPGAPGRSSRCASRVSSAPGPCRSSGSRSWRPARSC